MQSKLRLLSPCCCLGGGVRDASAARSNSIGRLPRRFAPAIESVGWNKGFSIVINYAIDIQILEEFFLIVRWLSVCWLIWIWIVLWIKWFSDMVAHFYKNWPILIEKQSSISITRGYKLKIVYSDLWSKETQNANRWEILAYSFGHFYNKSSWLA